MRSPITRQKLGRPIGVTRLGEQLVLWHDSQGTVACLRDLCPYRGVALSIWYGTPRAEYPPLPFFDTIDDCHVWSGSNPSTCRRSSVINSRNCSAMYSGGCGMSCSSHQISTPNSDQLNELATISNGTRLWLG